MAPQCFFLAMNLAMPTSPKKHYDAVQRYVETNIYRCGDLFQVYKNREMATALTDGADEEEEPMIFCRESHVYGPLVEAQYYATEGDIERWRRVSTKHISCPCYADSHLAKNIDVEAREERLGQGYLPMCKY